MGLRQYTRVSIFLLALTSAAGLLTGCSNTKVATVERTITTQEAVADFDRMWEIVNETHFDPDFNGVDWVAVRDELRPQAQAARTPREIRSVMRNALGRFGQSHFNIIPDRAAAPAESTTSANTETKTSDASESEPQSIPAIREIAIEDDSASDGDGDWDTGIDLQIIDGQAVISAVRDQSPAQIAGVQTGWVLTNVRSESLQEGLERLAEAVDGVMFDIQGRGMILNNHLQGPPDTTIDLTFLDRNDETVELNIAREPMPGELVKFGNLPPLSTHLQWSKIITTSPSGAQTEIGVIAFNIWMIPIMPQFEKAMYELRDVDGIIIDLRGNPGGIGGLASSIGRFLLPEKGSLGTMTMRGTQMKFNIEPVIVTTWGETLDPFEGSIAILIDSGSASTSEIFAGGLQSLGRVEVFGTRSSGQALAALMDRLPSGDVFIHAIADFETSTGHRLEHGGVNPNYRVPLTRADLINGIDSPKHAAMKWIEQSASE